MEKAINKQDLRDPAIQMWMELKTWIKQAGCKSASNVNEKRKKDAKDERQIFMMTVATSVVQ